MRFRFFALWKFLQTSSFFAVQKIWLYSTSTTRAQSIERFDWICQTFVEVLAVPGQTMPSSFPSITTIAQSIGRFDWICQTIVEVLAVPGHTMPSSFPSSAIVVFSTLEISGFLGFKFDLDRICCWRWVLHTI